MDDATRARVVQIFSEGDRRRWPITEPRRARSLLADYLTDPKDQRARNALVYSLDENVPGQLEGAQTVVDRSTTLVRLTRRLVDECSMQDEAARWAVETWAAVIESPATAVTPTAATARPSVAPVLTQAPSKPTASPNTTATQQPPPKEVSPLFSLRSLMELEDDRIRQETERMRRGEEDRLRAEVAAIKAEEERIETARRVEEERRRAAEVARRAEEERQFLARQEQELRLRLEAESKARELELQRRLEHEHKMAIIEASAAGSRGLSPTALVAGALLLASSLAAGGYFGIYRPNRQAQILAAQESDAHIRRVEADRVRAELVAAEELRRSESLAAEQRVAAATAVAPAAAHPDVHTLVGADSPARPQPAAPPPRRPGRPQSTTSSPSRPYPRWREGEL